MLLSGSRGEAIEVRRVGGSLMEPGAAWVCFVAANDVGRSGWKGVVPVLLGW